MFSFIARRLLATVLVLFVASFFVYVLTAYSGDPLLELRTSRDPEAAARIEYLTKALNLEVPPALRYFLWLGGAAGCLVGRCDLGLSISRGEQPVIDALGTAIGSTLQLVLLATILAIVVGVAIGMTTAIRQYSGYDYAVTFSAFIFFSLPIFWVAVLLKEFGAIKFNQFLGDPQIPLLAAVLISLVLALVVSGVIGGNLATRTKSFGITLALGAFTMTMLTVTNWLASPSVGIIGILITTIFIAAAAVGLGAGFKDKRALYTGGIMVVVAAALWYPLQFLFFYVNSPLAVIAVALLLGGIGFLTGYLLGGDAKLELGRLGAIIGALSTIPLVLDQMLMRWNAYVEVIPLKSGVISTIGAVTPSLGKNSDFWLKMLDSAAHLVLPTIALMIVSIAGYTRYSRASLLEVMNQDYIRTARAKGLSERVVIIRHAFRNAMIPIATIIAFDFGAVIGGAVITERVFAWQGMGALFSTGLHDVDVNLVMGFFLVTGLMAVLFNIVADLLYSALDPRIRVS